MRQAIDRVRARQLDIRETLQALDQLQAETGAEGAATTNPTGTTPSTAGGPTAAEGTGQPSSSTANSISTREEVARLQLALQSEPLLSDNFDMSALLGETTAGGSSSASVVPATTDHAPESTTTTASESAVEPPSSTTTESGSSEQLTRGGSGPRGTSAVNMLSAELNRRIEHLNQLERNVSDITQRLGVRMRSLNEERRRDLGRLRSRISTTQYSLSARLRERQDRLRAHLDEIRRRYRVPSAPRVIPEITVTPSPDENGAAAVTSTTSSSSALPASTTVSQAEEELRGLQASLGREERVPDVAQWSRNMNRDIEK